MNQGEPAYNTVRTNIGKKKGVCVDKYGIKVHIFMS